MASLSMTDLFSKRVMETPEHRALISESQSISYAELESRSNQLAHYLIRLGVSPGEPVGLAMNHSPGLVISMLAILKTGAFYVPIDMHYPEERIRFILADARIRLLLTQSESDVYVRHLFAQSINIDEAAPIIHQQPFFRPQNDIEPSGPAYMMYTSGTTGTPKGVLIPHRAVAHLTFQPSFLSLQSSDIVAFLSSISFDSSTLEIWSALLNGLTLAVPARARLSPDVVANTISTLQVSIIFLTPGLFNLMVEEHLQCLASVRYIISGGDVMSPAIAHRALRHLPNTKIINGYGPTENTIFTTTYQLPNAWDKNNTIPIGEPVAGTFLDIINKNGDSVAAGQAGELIVGGDGLCQGYWQRDDLNKSRFIEKGGKLYFRTGDVVRKRQDGQIEFIGRADKQVKIRGFRIELGEIENVLLQHSDIKAAIVTAAEVTAGDKRLIAYLIPEPQKELRLSDIRTFISQRLPEFMTPAHYIVREAFPLTHNGKIDRDKLHALCFERPDLGVDYIEPSQPLEEALCHLWSELLRTKPVGTRDHFFEMGGNSVLAAKAVVQMQPLLQKHLPSYAPNRFPSTALYEHPTIQSLMQLLEQGPAEVRGEFAADVSLDDGIRPSQAFQPDSFAQRAVLLTGSTGFLGAYLIKELISAYEDEDIQIYCMVRARDEQHALQRIQSNMEKYSLWEERYLDYIRAFAGQLELPRFGLSSGQFRKLAYNIDAIYHNGAKVNYVQSYALHKETNVTGTENILAFACEGRPKPVHFLSTIAVFGPAGYDSKTKCVYEDADLDSFFMSVQKDMGYSQSKWVAERLVWEASRRGVPVTVFRPGFIMGDSQTGINNTEDYMARLIKGCVQLRAFADLPHQRKEFVPVDFVSRSIVAIGRTPASFGKAYHLVPPHQQSMDLCDFFQKINDELGYPMEKLPYKEWVDAVVQASEHTGHALTPFLPLLTENVEQGKTVWELYENMPVFDSSNTQNALFGTGIACPDMDKGLLTRYFAYMTGSGFLEKPSKPSS